MTSGRPGERYLSIKSPRDYFAELVDQVDGFFARVAASHRDQMRCAAGCSRCCVDGLTVTAIEAAVIAEHVARSPVSINRGDGCAALDGDGRCQIYEARPILCRSHGVPLVERREGSLPVVSSSCELNFTEPGALESAGQDCQLDPETLGAKLWAIDAAWADVRGKERNRRFSILEVLENS